MNSVLYPTSVYRPLTARSPLSPTGGDKTAFFGVSLDNGPSIATLRPTRRRNFSSWVLKSVGSRDKRLLCCKSQLTSDLAPAVSAVYGTLLLTGGLFAYTKSGSKGSLFGGLTGGSLMAIVYVLSQSPETKQIGYALGFGSSLLFASIFGIRLAATRKIVPSGLLLAISTGALAVFVLANMEGTV
ncbi:protein FATTY ACID EXPORT 4, chloroplastic [Impatiens glandulifera]|uniref:protein FATTY ACID EXPORT 4, chloroplastic n=1 Tax=Impatiens glandulifera TaxID=253017 RepID=UPI001FB0E456|nr:protein FATTY ACID EXPORT 4, chloroplastic [Impatiens glandulifera]